MEEKRIPKPHSPGSSPGRASIYRTFESGDGEQKPLSRQRKWQLKQIAKGNCHLCGKPAVIGAVLCPKHLTKQRRYNRIRNGSVPQSRSGLGRKPLPLVTRKEAK